MSCHLIPVNACAAASARTLLPFASARTGGTGIAAAARMIRTITTAAT
jgi:hypothetical protein